MYKIKKKSLFEERPKTTAQRCLFVGNVERRQLENENLNIINISIITS